MDYQLHNLSSSDAPLLQDLAAKAVIEGLKWYSPELSPDRLASALTFLQHAFDSSNELMRECAAAVMSKLASTSARSALLETGCFPLLLRELESSSVHSLTSSSSMSSILAHAAGAIERLFEHDSTRSAAAETAGVVLVLVSTLGNSVNLSINLDHSSRELSTSVARRLGSNGAMAQLFAARDSNAKVQVAVTAALHALAKDSAHRQALAAACGVKGLVAALNSDRLARGAVVNAELALCELAEDPATAAGVIECGGVEYCMKVLTELLNETQEASTAWWFGKPYWDEDEREEVYPVEWDAQYPTVSSAIMAAKVVNALSALPKGRMRLVDGSRALHVARGLRIIKQALKVSSDIEGWPSDTIFVQLALAMFRLSKGQDSGDAVAQWLPPFLQNMVDIGMNEQEVQQELKARCLCHTMSEVEQELKARCLCHTMSNISFQQFVAGYSSD